LVIVALAGGIVLELVHAIEGDGSGLDRICRGASSRGAPANANW